MLDFVVASNVSCPQNLPMLRSDGNLSETAMIAAFQDPETPISDFIKKEFFFKCSKSFENAIKADPSLIADEVRKHIKRYDYLFGTHM